MKEKKNLVETLHNALLVGIALSDTTGTHLTQPEDTLDDAQLRRRRIQTRHGQPVVDDHAGADHGATAVDTTGDEGHLQQGGELILVADGGLGVNDTALVGEGHVGTGQDVVGHGLSEDFDAENVGNTGKREEAMVSRCQTSDGQKLMGRGAYISSVSRSKSGWINATWSLQQITLPRADSRSSIRWIFTESGSVFRRC